MSQQVPIPRVVLHPLGGSYLCSRNPWVPVWWSVVLPGFGHIHLGQNLQGLILMSLEIIINTQAHLNLAIFHTLQGHGDQAAAVLRYDWALFYPLFYLFAIIDSHRLAVDLNTSAALERLQKQRRFDRFIASVWSAQGLTRRNPFMAAFWSAVMTGVGHMYCGRLVKALILLGWYFVVAILSGLPMAFHLTLMGKFSLAQQAVDYQWLLFWPSIFVFGIADAYSDCVEQNTLFEMEFRYRMAPYLKNEDVRRGGETL